MHVSQGGRRLSAPVRTESGLATRVVRALDHAGVLVDDVEVHQPSLDDVFFALTGRRRHRRRRSRSTVKRGSHDHRHGDRCDHDGHPGRADTGSTGGRERYATWWSSPGATSCISPANRCSSPMSPCSPSSSRCCSSTCSARAWRCPAAGSYVDFALGRAAGAEPHHLCHRHRGGAQHRPQHRRHRPLPVAAHVARRGARRRSIADVLSATLCVVIVALTGLCIGWRSGTSRAVGAGRVRAWRCSSATPCRWGCACLGIDQQEPGVRPGPRSRRSSSRSPSCPTPWCPRRGCRRGCGSSPTGTR